MYLQPPPILFLLVDFRFEFDLFIINSFDVEIGFNVVFFYRNRNNISMGHCICLYCIFLICCLAFMAYQLLWII